MITVGDVYVDIRARVDKLQDDMAKAKGSVSNAIGGIQTQAAMIGGVLASIGVGAFADTIRNAIDAAGSLADLSQKTGISASELSKLDYAAKMSGTNIEGVATGIRKLGGNMVDAQKPTSDAAAAFKALGVEVNDAQGKLKTGDTVLAEIADKFSKLPNGVEKTDAAVKLFGKTGSDLIPLLNEGAGGIEKLKKEAEALGLVVDDDTATAMEALGDELDAVGLAQGSLTKNLAAEMTPALSMLAGSFLNSAKEGGGLRLAVDAIGGVLKTLITIGTGAAAAFNILGNTLGGVAAAAVTALSDGFDGAKKVMKAVEDKNTDLIQQYDSKLSQVWTKEAAQQREIKAETDKTVTTKANVNTESEKQAKKTADVIDKLKEEKTTLGLTTMEAEIYKKQKEAGTGASQAELNKIAELVTQIHNEKEEKKKAKETTEALEKARKDHTKELGAELQKITDAVTAERERNTTLGKSKTEIAALTLAEMERTAELLIATEASDEDVIAIGKRIDKQKELVGELAKGEAAAANLKSAQDAQKAWDETSKSIENALTDSLMRGFDSGKGFVSSLIDYVKNAFKTNVIKMIVQPIMGGINSMFSPNAMAGGAGGGGSIMDLLSSGKSITEIVSGGMSSITSSFASLGSTVAEGAQSVINMFGPNTGMYSPIGSGMPVSSMAQGIGTAGSYLGGAAIGVMAGRAISGGYSAIGSGSGNTAVNVGTAIGAIWGPLGAAIGGAIGGLVNRAFGRGPKEMQETGIMGTVGGGTASGEAYANWRQKGGWFRSDKTGTDISALPAELSDLLSSGGKAILDTTVNLAKSLKLPFEQLQTLKSEFRVALTGDAKKDGDLIAQVLADYQTSLSNSLAPYLATFRKTGESLTETLQRIAAVQLSREFLNQFGGIFSVIAESGIEATEAMIQLAGGIDALISKAQSFVKEYYTTGEQAGMSAKGLLDQLAAAGINGGELSNRAGFRALVESRDVTTQQGREQLNLLLSLAPQFAQISQFMADSKLTLEGVAKLAPAFSALDPLFQQQIAGANATATESSTTTAAVDTLAGDVRDGTIATVNAIGALSTTVTTAVTVATSATNAALATLSGRLDAMEASNRLAASAPYQQS